MADTAIEWTDAVLKHCGGCGQDLPHSAFARDATRTDGLTFRCKTCRNATSRALYRPKDPVRGRRRVGARDGDQLQARRRVNYLVDIGQLAKPNEVPCVDCGHLGEGPRHEYDHHLGYAAEHHEDVEAVCSGCHHKREKARRG